MFLEQMSLNCLGIGSPGVRPRNVPGWEGGVTNSPKQDETWKNTLKLPGGLIRRGGSSEAVR